MASKLDTSLPQTREVYPPGPLRARREGGTHEISWRSGRTIERQITNPSPLAKNFTNFRMAADPEIIRRETPLFAPGRGKAAGSKRTMRFRKPPYDTEGS